MEVSTGLMLEATLALRLSANSHRDQAALWMLRRPYTSAPKFSLRELMRITENLLCTDTVSNAFVLG